MSSVTFETPKVKFKMTFLTFVSVICALLTAANGNPSRISGGAIADIRQYPFATSLLSNQGESAFSQRCGGTIISNTAVLSAASCFVTNNVLQSISVWRARVGSTSSNTRGLVHRIRNIVVHEQYQAASRVNDLAVLRVTVAFAYSDAVQAAYIAGGSYVLSVNDPVWAIGWGATSATSESSPDLRQVQIWVNEQQLCTDRYSEVAFNVTNEMLCAGWLDVGVRGQCQGDAGSPLLHNDVVVGVYSWSQSCGNSRYPNINTRVSAYSRWIEATATIEL